MIDGKAIGDAFETKARVTGESRINFAVLDNAIVAEIGGDEGDVNIGETEKLGEPEHGVYVSLNWQREDEDMRREF